MVREVTDRVDAVERFLKHKLNAQAIASLEGELGMIETYVAALIRDMEASIARSRDFVEEMQLLGGNS